MYSQRRYKNNIIKKLYYDDIEYRGNGTIQTQNAKLDDWDPWARQAQVSY